MKIYTFILTSVMVLISCGGGAGCSGVGAALGQGSQKVCESIQTDKSTLGNSNQTVSNITTTFSDLVHYANQISAASFEFQPAGVVFVSGMDAKERVFIFPTLFYSDPLLPAVEFASVGLDSFGFKKYHDEVKLGSARDWKLMDIHDSTRKRFVVVDHGPEYSSATWPFGYVWVATDSGTGFSFQKISSDLAFNHSVAVGDLSGVGRDDVLVSNMGVKSGPAIYNSIHYYQSMLGSYNMNTDSFLNNIPAITGAVAIGDLDGDGKLDVIQATYLRQADYPEGEWGGVRIWSKNNASYGIAKTLPREGLFATMGATQVSLVDYDKDGDLDIIVFLEGAVEGSTNRYNANGIEIYSNNGGLNFQRVTSSLLKVNYWNFSDLHVRELAIGDFNNDGFSDILLNGWKGELYNKGQGLNINLGSLIFLNENGLNFKHLKDVGNLSIKFDDYNKLPQFLRFMSAEKGVTRFFGISQDGRPLVVRHTIN